MATTLSFTSSSPHSLIGRIASTAGAADVLPRANVLAACAAGPLKALLTRITDWTVFNLGAPLCKAIHIREVINRSSGVEASTSEFLWLATSVKFCCDANTDLQIEIRLSHTIRA
jgi:hypothetical protein